MTSSLLASRRGAQRPRIEHIPHWSQNRADDAMAFLSEVCGLDLDEWQQYVLRHSLGQRDDGKFSAFEVAVVVPRQNGKNVLIEARQLIGLFLLGERLIIHSAHEAATANEAFRDLRERFQKHPDLMREVRGFRGDSEDLDSVPGFKRGNAERSIELKNGSRIVYKTRTDGGGRGLTGDLVIMDEAFSLKHDHIAALMPTMAARTKNGNPQMWYTSSAGMHDSEVLAQVRERYMTGNGAKRLAGFEWSADESELDEESEDLEATYTSNPSLGVHLSHEYVFDTERASFSSGENEGGIERWRRERLGIWAKLGGESVFPDGVWEACAFEKSVPDDNSLFFAVDVSPSRDSASIALVSPLDDGRVHVEIVDNQVGTSWVGLRLKELKDRWNPSAIVAIAGSAAESLMPSWKRDGARVTLIRFTDYKNACGVFFDLVTQGKMAHRDDDTLNAAVDGAKQTWTQDNASWYWSRKKSDADITPLAAVTVGLAGMEKKSRVRRDPSKPRGVIL